MAVLHLTFFKSSMRKVYSHYAEPSLAHMPKHWHVFTGRSFVRESMSIVMDKLFHLEVPIVATIFANGVLLGVDCMS